MMQTAGPKLLLLLLLLLLLTACEPTYPAQSHAALQRTALLTATATLPATRTPPATATLPATATASLTATPTATATASATPTPRPVQVTLVVHTATPGATPSPPPTASPTPAPTATATPLAPCSERVPADDLFTIVTRTYALSRDYEPADLVPLDAYFPYRITLGYETTVRAIIVSPLQALVAEMEAAGLHPTVISGYRSYSTQALAWNKWIERYPDTGALLSAQPGTSEHQLGTTVDFGSPELNNEFHTMFYATAEGQWLLANAHRFGFTLSYPREAFELTQFYYEPWHYRYVGIELATQLYNEKRTLTEYLLTQQLPPCVPDA